MKSRRPLVAQLIEIANVMGDPHALLHERVVLYRLDGSRVAGRLRVRDAVQQRGSDARFHVLWESDSHELVHVALRVPEMAGEIVFAVRGEVHPIEGTLVRVWMEDVKN